MKIFCSESLVDYKSYTFNYAMYCLKENDSDIPEIYNKGFLPYSNHLELKEEVYYLARSLRVNLNNFSETSENRRVCKNLESLNPNITIKTKAEFNLSNPDFIQFCYRYAQERFSEPLSMARLKYILDWESLSHVFCFTLDGDAVGYVLAIIKGKTLHYWFAFYDLDLSQKAIGKFMMFRVIKWAKENNLDFVYLGTCYGEKSLYKVRDFKGLEFFDGNLWKSDMNLLKLKCKSDSEFTTDQFKLDSNSFLKGL